MAAIKGVERIFSIGGPMVDFSRSSKKFVSGRAKNGEMSFYPFEIKKTTFFC